MFQFYAFLLGVSDPDLSKTPTCDCGESSLQKMSPRPGASATPRGYGEVQAYPAVASGPDTSSPCCDGRCQGEYLQPQRSLSSFVPLNRWRQPVLAHNSCSSGEIFSESSGSQSSQSSVCPSDSESTPPSQSISDEQDTMSCASRSSTSQVVNLPW